MVASLSLGLCADCTALEVQGNTLYMYRPACCGNVIAVNADQNAPIFDYADFGIVADVNFLF